MVVEAPVAILALDASASLENVSCGASTSSVLVLSLGFVETTFDMVYVLPAEV